MSPAREAKHRLKRTDTKKPDPYWDNVTARASGPEPNRSKLNLGYKRW